MLGIRDAIQAGTAFMEKGAGLALEAAGTFLGNERLTDAGRRRQDAASERLMAIEEEIRAAGQAAKAEAY